MLLLVLLVELGNLRVLFLLFILNITILATLIHCACIELRNVIVLPTVELSSVRAM